MDFLITLVDFLFYALNLAIFARILLSWLPLAGIQVSPYNPIVQLLFSVTDPILEPFRRVIPPLGMMDISPIVAVIVLQIIQSLVVSMLRAGAY